jgi:hypothetical protein
MGYNNMRLWGSCFTNKILGYIYWGRTGSSGLASFLGLVGPVLGALKLLGRASMVLGEAKPVLGTP